MLFFHYSFDDFGPNSVDFDNYWHSKEILLKSIHFKNLEIPLSWDQNHQMSDEKKSISEKYFFEYL